MSNWLVSDTHQEPSNEELGIKPWDMRKVFRRALVAVIAVLLGLAFI